MCIWPKVLNLYQSILYYINMQIHLGVLKLFSDSVCEMYMEYIFYMCAKNIFYMCAKTVHAAAWTVFDVCLQTKVHYSQTYIALDLLNYLRHKELVMVGISKSLTTLVKPFIFAKTCSNFHKRSDSINQFNCKM